MKLFSNCFIITLLTLMLFSCKDEDIMLYHEKEAPVPYWLLEEVNYPDYSLGLTDRKSYTFSYTENDILTKIEKLDPETMAVDYRDNFVIYSAVRHASSYDNLDSIMVKLDANKRAVYTLHAIYNRYSDTGDIRIEPGLVDSTAYTYDAAGYLIKLDRYARTESDSEITYSETRTITNGNLTEIITSTGHKYTYTYNDMKYYPASEYCYEMPDNNRDIYHGGCLTLKNQVFFSHYLGKKNLNSIKQLVITDLDPTTTEYANLMYDYTVDDNDQLAKVKMSGTVNGNTLPEDYVTSFSYLEKTKDKN